LLESTSKTYPLGLRMRVGHVIKILGAGLLPAPPYHLDRIYTLLPYVTAATRICLTNFIDFQADSTLRRLLWLGSDYDGCDVLVLAMIAVGSIVVSQC
jgi:hypothetical protein